YQSRAESVRQRPIATRNNLPLQLTRLIGRKTELTQIQGLLEKHRLVSVVGTGGTGKTRVAIAAASQVSERFADGAWFVDLSRISDPSLVASTIAAIFGAEVPIEASAADALAVIFESRDVLLVIDNCEHLIAEVAKLSVALLRHCHKLSILTTSREPLGIAGEAVYRLPLLGMPAPDAKFGAADALGYDAIALFAERASEANRDFALDDKNLPDVVRICRTVDGIALAIELAASRVGILGSSQVAQRLQEFRLLSGGDRTALPRQRTMHATIGWSYDLLTEPERTLFRRLSVFAGGFTFDAVTEVGSGTIVEAEDVFDVLSSLIRKSLVADDPGHELRYRLLDSVRAFARDKLYEAGEAERAARRHGEYYVSIARQADAMYRRTPSREWLDALEPDVDNFRAALEWSLDQRGDVVLGATLAAATISFFNDCLPSEAVRWMTKALDLLPRGAAPRIEARLCLGLATSSSRSLPAARLRSGGERAIEIFRSAHDRQGLCEALRGTAQIIGWYFRKDRELADRLACESIEIARELGDPLQLAFSLRTRGLTIDISDFVAKRAVLEESLALIRKHGNDRQTGNMLTWISDLEFSAGNERRALEYGREAVRLAESCGSNELYANTTNNFASYACALGEWDVARQAASEALRISRKTSHYEGLTFAVQAFAFLAAEFGDYERAAALIGFCDARCGVLHVGRQADQSEDIIYRRLMAMLVEALDRETLEARMREGAAMNEEEAAALAQPPSRT
ncbi:MAG TPA: hypothetical protein VNG31_04570, partial [Candidatus Baltobacteraceae bacterium]|nr:hypothetical protein [Candidatus Baltobacteraceae bacterium]